MTNSTTSAKTLIQEQVASMLVEPLEAESVVLSSGPTIFNSSEPLRIPRLTSGFTPSIVGENEQIPETEDAGFDEIKLMPGDRKSIKSIIRISNELIRAAKTGVSTQLQTRLVKDVSNQLDHMLLKGDGTDGGATGFLHQAGTQQDTLDTAKPDSLLDMLGMAAAKEVKPNRWFLSGEDYLALSKLKDNNGRYLMQQSTAIDGAMVRTLFDVPVTVTNKLAKGEGALVDMKEVAVVRDIDPQVTILNERYAEFDQIGIRVVTRYDLGLLHPEGVIVFGGAPSEV